jgi:hypothetical protein
MICPYVLIIPEYYGSDYSNFAVCGSVGVNGVVACDTLIHEFSIYLTFFTDFWLFTRIIARLGALELGSERTNATGFAANISDALVLGRVTSLMYCSRDFVSLKIS